MSLPISDYAIIGDTHTTALISREGSVDWLCWPRHDSPALFLKLLDDDKGGACTIAFSGLVGSARRYVTDTNVLETTFETKRGTAVLTDFMPVYPPSTMPAEGPDGDAESRLIRILSCESGMVVGRFTVRPTFDYARCDCTPVLEAGGGVLFEAGEHRIRLTSSHAAVLEGNAAVIAFTVQAGERLHLVLTQVGGGGAVNGGTDDGVAAVEGLPAALQRLDETTDYWQRWSGQCRYDGPHSDAVRRSALVLKLMTYAPTGAIIAAPTMGLPEAIPGNRNFDYRYAWLRDASFTITAFVNLGYNREAEEYLRFLRIMDESRGRDVRLMYGVAGVVPEEETLGHLAGWCGVGPVTFGNTAATQTQHDIYGELLLAIEVYLDANDFHVPAEMQEGLPELIHNLADRAMAARSEPDQGIWEPRGPAQHFLHSKALIWVALDRAARIGARLPGIDEAQYILWGDAAAAIRAEYLEHGWNEARGSYVQAYGSHALDASILRIALFGALPLDDGRLERSLDAIGRELGDGDLVYRYRTEDGLEGQEGTFTACAFWYAGCLALTGRLEEARARVGRLLGRANDVGLFAEEIDAASGEQRGNFPQGFTHMALINHLVRLMEFGQGTH